MADRKYPYDPVVETYKKDIDRSLLRENLRRTVEERLVNLQQLAAAAEAIREAGRRSSPSEIEATHMQNIERQHITKTAGVCGGRACIAGHRIRVMDIVVLHEMRGSSPQEIVEQFPGITLADVYAALTYYLDNRQEIEEEFKKDDEWAEWVKANIPSKIPPELRKQLSE